MFKSSTSPSGATQALERRKRPLAPAIHAFLVLITAATVLIEVWSRQVAWDGYLAESRVATGNIAQAASEHAVATLSSVRGMLDGMVERIETDGVEGAAGVRLHRYMGTRRALHPALHGLFVYDRTGQLVVSTGGPIRPGHNNADRAYFIHHRAHADRREYLGKPVIGKSSGEWVVTMSRRIDDAHGGFAGVVVASIGTDYFRQYYERFSIGPRGAIVLAFADGAMITRLPHGDDVPGRSIRRSPLFRFIERTGAASGSVMLVNTFDGVERQHSFVRVPGFPLLVAAAQARDEIMREWWRATWHEGVVLLLMLAAVHAGGFWLISQFRVRDRLEASLRAAQAELEQRNAELARQARTDALTGLCNRRCLDDVLAVELARAARGGGALALVMLDADYFKRYNDTYGHAAGDDCLCTLAAVLRATVNRPGDVVARFGGEEFAVLLPDTAAQGALAVAEAIRTAVAERALPHSGNPAGIVTVSAGVATTWAAAADPATAARTLLEAADAALYAAKAAGRDCVRLAEGDGQRG